MATWPKKRWFMLAGVLSAAVGTTVGLAVHGLAGPGHAGAVVASGIVGAGFTGWTVLAVCLQLRQRRRGQELRGLVNVRPLTGRLPLDLGSWAVDPVLADELVRLLCRRRPERIVECGSGWTTVLMAACLAELEIGTVTALEHEEKFARQTRELLAAGGAADRAEVLLAPLEAQDVDGTDWLWYHPTVVESVEGPIDLLLVDGPPGKLAAEIRYPAIPLLRNRLARDCVVFLDDGFRDDEMRTARSWGRKLGVEPVLVPRGGGFWILDGAGSERKPPEGETRCS